MADIPSFEEFKKSQGPVPNFEDFKAQQKHGDDSPLSLKSGTRGSEIPGRFAGAVAENLNPIPFARSLLHPIDTVKGMFAPKSTMRSETPESELPQDAFHKFQRAIGGGPNAPAMRVPQQEAPIIGEAMNGHIPEAAGHLASIPLAMAIPGLMGRGLRSPAPTLAENALGIRGAAREYGATPGKAILEDTRGVAPATVERSANQKIGELTTDLENRARASTQPVSLAPARRVISDAIANAKSGNSVPRSLFPIQEQLEVPRPGFAGRTDQPPAPMVPTPSGVLGPNGQPIMTMKPGPLPPATVSATQKPVDFLGMKRRIGEDFTKFTPGASTDESLDVANRVYGQMARDFDTSVPGGAALNQRIQSLIPVARRAHAVDLNAGPLERTIDRATRPTGGLLAPIVGYGAAGPLGAGAMAAGQEALSSPTFKLGLARGLHVSGRVMGIPEMKQAGALVPLTRMQQNQ